MNLNFKMSELVKSQTAIKNNINNLPTSTDSLDNMLFLIFNILQPLRDRFGVININSGYRCPKLNILVKGSVNSNHLYGRAADITAKEATLEQLYNYVIAYLDFDECFIETNKAGAQWLHVAYNRANNRRKTNKDMRAF